MDKQKIDLLVAKRKDNPKGWKKWLTGKAQQSLLQELEDAVPLPISLSEKIVWLRDGLIDYPKCPVCGNNITRFDVEYSKFCSCKCAQNSKDIRDKLKQTCINKYGVDNAAKSEIVQMRMKQTCLERFGTTNVFASEYGKEKIKETNLKKFGVENPQQCRDIKEKTNNTMISKYGKKCIAGDYIRHVSRGELELYDFIKSLCSNAKHIDRLWISPMELDISIRERNIAFEYDGDFWHSLPDMVERDTKKNQICESMGIKLIRIKESDWKNNKELVCSMIKEILSND